jgi:hypothetical protein
MPQAERKQDGKRWTFPAEVEDLLSHSIFLNAEVLFLEPSDDPPRSLAEHGDIEHDQLSAQLDLSPRFAPLGHRQKARIPIRAFGPHRVSGRAPDHHQKEKNPSSAHRPSFTAYYYSVARLSVKRLLLPEARALSANPAGVARVSSGERVDPCAMLDYSHARRADYEGWTR